MRLVSAAGVARPGGGRLAGTRALIGSGHPKPALAMTLLLTALAVATGREPGGILLVAAAVLSGQLSIGWLNDLVDAERDRHAGRLDKPLAAGAVSTRAVEAAALVAAMACVPLSLASGVLPGVLHLAAVGAGWAYDLRLKGSRFSVVTFAVALALAPLFVVLGLPGPHHPPWWLPAVTVLLGCGLHFANVLRDLDDDVTAGVWGLPQRLGRSTSRLLAAALALGAVLVLAIAAPLPLVVAVGAPALAALALAVGFRLGRDRRSQRPLQAVSAVSLLAVGLLLSLGSELR